MTHVCFGFEGIVGVRGIKIVGSEALYYPKGGGGGKEGRVIVDVTLGGLLCRYFAKPLF